MIAPEVRQVALELVDEAIAAGARQSAACAELGVSARTLQRYRAQEAEGEPVADRRPEAEHPAPPNKLTDAERRRILEVTCAPEFASLPPSQIVPILADRGEYIGSESTFYRVLHEHQLQHHRQRSKPPEPRPIPTHQAEGPNEVWSWDITWLPGPAKGLFFYLYMIMDIYSRKIIAWEVHESESAEHAKTLVRQACLSEQLNGRPLVLHSDNGSPMKAQTYLALLETLGLTPSHSRPRVSDDNPFSESLFRTVKARPTFKINGFRELGETREWVADIEHWYNDIHRHSGINFVTPTERHSGADKAVLSAREIVYGQAREAHPERWIGATRNWAPPGIVELNRKKTRKERVSKKKGNLSFSKQQKEVTMG